MFPAQMSLTFGHSGGIKTHWKQWINIKKAFQKFYNKRANGMMEMLKVLKIPHTGKHHSGIDDCKNIAKIVVKMIQDGAVLSLTWRHRV